jgi:hypothetical protein
MSKKESQAQVSEPAVAYTAALLDRPVGEITVRHLRELIREVVREEWRRPLYVDSEGYLVFPDERAYAAYLDAHPDKYPSELHAYYLDEHGFKIYYSDWEPTPEKARELDKARRQIAKGETYRLEDVIKELGLEDIGNV